MAGGSSSWKRAPTGSLPGPAGSYIGGATVGGYSADPSSSPFGVASQNYHDYTNDQTGQVIQAGTPLSILLGNSPIPGREDIGYTSPVGGFTQGAVYDTRPQVAAASGSGSIPIPNPGSGGVDHAPTVYTPFQPSTGSAGTTESWASDQENFGAPGGHWGGSSDHEAALITSDLSDDDFWETFEAGEVNDSNSGWANDGDPTNDLGNPGWGFTSIADMFDGGGPGQSGDSFTGGIHGDNTVGNATDGWQPTDLVNDRSSDDNDSGGSSSSSSSSCVVASYAHSQGVDIGRKEAVKWCINNLHGHWAGEVVRKGYRYLGRKRIEAGTASNHFNEFQLYVDYATNKDKSLRGAATFYGRTVQFFVVGLFVN